ncbi:phage holin family protein [Pseudarthrobacter sp. P1]|uniref:phage holin family protein n=1 Tax=Pseudarthrobacter sp. P1 TaxID=3418418 RepID=UPI003CEEAEB1
MSGAGRGGPEARGGTSWAGEDSLVAALKTAGRLVPRQLNDELELAKAEFKRKGVKVGVASGFLGGALVFACLLVTALVVAAIAGLATVMPLWLSALLVSALFLVVAAVCGLIGVRKLKKTMPLIPEDAWRGIRHDLGIAKEGRGFDPATLVAPEPTKEERAARKAEKRAAADRAKAEHESKAAENGPTPNVAELLARTTTRRAHLLALREDIMAKANVKTQTAALASALRAEATSRVSSAAHSAAPLVDVVVTEARNRWLPLGILAVSGTALVLLLRKLLKK